ncbi:MAG: hypothetical protein ACOC5T_06655 [Elusimicrobiota bacterium]
MFEKLKKIFPGVEDFDAAQEKISDLVEKEKQFGEFKGFLKKLGEEDNLESIQVKIKTAKEFIEEVGYPLNFNEVNVAEELSSLLEIDEIEKLKQGISTLYSKIEAATTEGSEGKEDLTTENLLNQEICAVGDYGEKGKITEEDLDAIAKNATTLAEKIKPPLKFGHSEEDTGLPALGWVTNIRKEGQKLLADFKEVPKKIGEFIRAGGYKRVSPEIYTDEVEGTKPPILRAVALLGQDIPQIKNLKDLSVMYNSEGGNKLSGSLIVSGDKYQEPKPKPKDGGDDMDKEKMAALEKTTAQLKRENTEMKVNKFMEDNKTKILPTQEEIVKQLLVNTFDEEAKPVVKYSEGKGEDKKDVELNTFQAVTELIKRIPDVVDFSEKGKSGGKEETGFDKVAKYAEENKVTIKEAREALEAKGVDLTTENKE